MFTFSVGGENMYSLSLMVKHMIVLYHVISRQTYRNRQEVVSQFGARGNPSFYTYPWYRDLLYFHHCLPPTSPLNREKSLVLFLLLDVSSLPFPLVFFFFWYPVVFSFVIWIRRVMILIFDYGWISNLIYEEPPSCCLAPLGWELYYSFG